MKKALISYQGWVQQIVNPGEDYEIYEGPDATVAWVDAPDEITLDWTLEWSPSQQKMIWIERDGAFTDSEVARKVAYGPLEEQLDMLYHELDETGTISKTGTWYQHVKTVKTVISAPPPPPATPLTMEDLLAKAATEEPAEDKPNMPSTPEMQAWRRYEHWKGNKS